MAFTLNRRLAQLVDSNGQLNTGKIPNDYITSDHVADNTITSAMLHTSFTVSTSNLTAIDTDDVSEGSTNLYYTDARVGTYISGNRDYGNITTTGYIAGPATFTIDPAAVGDNTGTVVIAGNLQVDGTTTTINSTTMEVDDLNITLASGAANAAAANGAGLTVDGASATITYDGTNDVFDFNKGLTTLGKLLIGDTVSDTDDLLQIETPASGGGHGIQIRRNDSNNDQGVGHIQFGNNTDTDLAKISAKTDGSTDNAALLFHTQPNGGSLTERMRIDSSGNIQIGTSNPSGNKGITIEAGTDSSASLRLKNDAHDWDVNCQTNDKFAIYSHTAGTERLVIGTSGNVGIGTSSPDAKLSVVGTSLTNVSTTGIPAIRAQGGYGGGIGLLDGTKEAGWYTQDNGDTLNQYIGRTVGSDTPASKVIMTYKSTGNVGIGTSSPATELQIGDYSDDLEQITIATASDQTGRINFYNNNSTEGASIRVIGGGNGAKMYFANRYDVDSDKVVFDLVNGRVGVGAGTTSPDDTLHVESPGATARIKIGSGNAAYYTRKGYLGDEWVFGTGETGDNVDFKIFGGAFTAANAGGNFRFFTQMSNGTPAERMLISSEGYLEINSFSAQPDDTDTSTHRKIEFKANGGGTQTHKRDCFVQNNVGNSQYHWYKIVLGSNIYGRGSNIKYTANWSTGHASGQGIVDGSFICRAQHNDSRISVHGHVVYSRQVIGGTYYAWSDDPDITLYTSTATGSSAGLYMRVSGARTSGYDGAAIHALYLEIFGSRNDTAYQGIYHVGTSTPSDAGSAISRTILS